MTLQLGSSWCSTIVRARRIAADINGAQASMGNQRSDTLPLVLMQNHEVEQASRIAGEAAAFLLACSNAWQCHNDHLACEDAL